MAAPDPAWSGDALSADLPRLNPRQQAVLAMQRRSGNAAVLRALARRDPAITPQPAGGSGPHLQRGLLDDLMGAGRHAGNLMFSPTDPLGSIFETVVLTNMASSSAIEVPARYPQKVREYALDNPADGVFLLAGMGRSPGYRSGGWILDVQTGAKAMTLDANVFVRGDLDIGTYAHEMVHVAQYTAGATAFLVSYFGLSAATIAWRFINREPLNMMRSSPHEEQAYNIESRFMSWLASHP
jgi:hypothetical protein